LGLFFNGEAFLLNYKKASTTAKNANAMLWVVQPGVKYNYHDWLDFKGAIAGYIFTGVRNRATFNGRITNSVNSTGGYKYDYNSVNPSIEFGIKEPFKNTSPLLARYIPYVGFFSDFIYNPSPATGKSGYDYGFKFGAEKVADWGQWQARVDYGKLGRDAWLDIFPDSDRYSGKTNMQSWEANFEYGLNKNSTLNLNYHWGQSLSTNGSTSDSFLPQQLILVDWNLKW
jgi:hypothetical protein